MKSFGFNLLPQKPKEQVVKEEERDRSSVYTAILPLFGVSLWLALLLFNGLVVDRVKANWESAIAQKLSRIDTEYASVRIQNGELVKKTQALAKVIAKDIQPEELFVLTEILFPVPEEDVVINGYGRNRDGSFSVTISTTKYDKFAEVARRFTEYDGIKQVNVKNVRLNEELQLIDGIVNFFFVEENELSVNPSAT